MKFKDYLFQELKRLLLENTIDTYKSKIIKLNEYDFDIVYPLHENVKDQTNHIMKFMSLEEIMEEVEKEHDLDFEIQHIIEKYNKEIDKK